MPARFGTGREKMIGVDSNKFFRFGIVITEKRQNGRLLFMSIVI
jgi:hypothetical protein